MVQDLMVLSDFQATFHTEMSMVFHGLHNLVFILFGKTCCSIENRECHSTSNIHSHSVWNYGLFVSQDPSNWQSISHVRIWHQCSLNTCWQHTVYVPLLLFRRFNSLTAIPLA